MQNDFLQLLITALVSGLIGVLVSNWQYKKSEKRRVKMETLKNLLAYRYEVTENYNDSNAENFYKTLNEVCIVFGDSKSVLNKLSEMKNLKEKGTGVLVPLIKEMCKDLKFDLDHDVFDSNFLMEPFVKNKI